MSTTSLKLSEELRRLAADAARHQGLSPHAFMVEAIRTAASAVHQRAAFVADAVAAHAEAVQSGQGHAAAEVHAYLRVRAKGRPAPKPKARAWRA